MSEVSLGLGPAVSASALYEEDTSAAPSRTSLISKGALEVVQDDCERPGPSTGTHAGGGTGEAVGYQFCRRTAIPFIEDCLMHQLQYDLPLGTDVEEFQSTTGWKNRNEAIVVVRDFEVGKFDSGSGVVVPRLSDIVTLEAKYKEISSTGSEDKVGLFILKLPPKRMEDRQLAGLADVHTREVNFYTKVVPGIEVWADRRGLKLDLPIPKCYYGKAQEEQLLSMEYNKKTLDLSKAESLLILQDLCPEGFGKRSFQEQLSDLEVKAALREIAKVHAVTWALGRESGVSLNETWPSAYRHEQLAGLYEMLLETALPKLEDFVAKANHPKLPPATQVFAHLKEMESHGIRSFIHQLLSPSTSDHITCLVHMDCWTDNLLFRKGYEEVRSLENRSKDESDCLECKIIDWQMFSVGLPTNDLALLLLTAMDSARLADKMFLLVDFYYTMFQETAASVRVPVTFGVEDIFKDLGRSLLFAFLQIVASVDLALMEESTRLRLTELIVSLLEDGIL